jgi:RNA polymerase sigma factor (sigma-70 family)
MGIRTVSGVVLRAQSDERLVTLAATGSDVAFEALVHRYRRALHNHCRLLIADSRSEDIVQQALLDAWSALQRGTEVREPRAWLYRITHHRAVAALRQPEYDYDTLSESLRGAAAAPEAELEQRVLMRETIAAVAALPSRQREAILRTAVEGQTYEEVAAALQLSDHAVRGLVHRARASLRATLAAITPTPVVLWAAGQPGRTASLAQWVGTSLAGGTTGGAAVALKGAAVLATSAAIIGGGAPPTINPAHHRADQRHEGAAQRRRGPTGPTAIGKTASRLGGPAGPATVLADRRTVSATAPAAVPRNTGSRNGPTGASSYVMGTSRSPQSSTRASRARQPAPAHRVPAAETDTALGAPPAHAAAATPESVNRPSSDPNGPDAEPSREPTDATTASDLAQSQTQSRTNSSAPGQRSTANTGQPAQAQARMISGPA